MTWRNLGAIDATKKWQYTQPIGSNIVRLRHVVEGGTENAPYGFKGAIALAYNFDGPIEHTQYRNIYPSTIHSIFQFDNLFPKRETRIAVRGQRKYAYAPNWLIYLDYWDSEVTESNNEQITAIEQEKQFYILQ